MKQILNLRNRSIDFVMSDKFKGDTFSICRKMTRNEAREFMMEIAYNLNELAKFDQLG